MNAGKLRHRLEVQRKTESRDSRGGVIETWTTTGTRWGAVEPLRMQERFEAQQLDARLSHRITLRHASDLSTQDRLVMENTRIFHIHSVRHPRERTIATEVLCMEQVNALQY